MTDRLTQADLQTDSTFVSETEAFALYRLAPERRVRVMENAHGTNIGMFLNFFILNKEHDTIETYGAVESYMTYMMEKMQEHIDNQAAEKAAKESTDNVIALTDTQH